MSQFATVPYNPRFPNTNQTKHCWVSYVKYHRCRLAEGEDSDKCAAFQSSYRTLCPTKWVRTRSMTPPAIGATRAVEHAIS